MRKAWRVSDYWSHCLCRFGQPIGQRLERAGLRPGHGAADQIHPIRQRHKELLPGSAVSFSQHTVMHSNRWKGTGLLPGLSVYCPSSHFSLCASLIPFLTSFPRLLSLSPSDIFKMTHRSIGAVVLK